MNNACKRKRCPLFLAAAYLHYKSDQESYEMFFSAINRQMRLEAKKLKRDFKEITVDQIEFAAVDKGSDPCPIISSDQEAAMVNAARAVWPKSSHAFCTRHLQDNLSRWLERTVRVEPKLKNKVIHKLFGENTGLVYAENEAEYLTKRACFETQFGELCAHNYMTKFLDTLKSNVLHPFWKHSNLMPSHKNNGK